MPQNCYWPLDPSDDRLCSFNVPDSGMHKCWHGKDFEEHILPFNPGKLEAWCGSNWDAFGNFRFAVAISTSAIADSSTLYFLAGHSLHASPASSMYMLYQQSQWRSSFEHGPVSCCSYLCVGRTSTM